MNELFEDWGGLEVLQKGWGEYTCVGSGSCILDGWIDRGIFISI